MSFFDEENQEQHKFWDKRIEQMGLCDLKNSIIEATFYKKSKKLGKEVQLQTIIKDEQLYYIKSINNVLDIAVQIKILDLTFTQVEFRQIHNNLDESMGIEQNEEKLEIQFCRNGKIKIFIIKQQEIIENLRQVLAQKCLQKSFHEEFTVQKMIGKGTFAKVYLCTRNSTQQEYAVKAFSKQFIAAQNKGKKALKNEIKLLKKLTFQNLIKLFWVFETQNSIYLILDALRGGELFNNIRQKQSLTSLNVKMIMSNLLLALRYLHLKGIAHRDIKPENILLRTADFGLACEINEKDLLFKRCGTPGFVAPEVLEYKDNQQIYGTKCDIFSAGIIFYLLCFGTHPFTGQDYKEILRKNKKGIIDFAPNQQNCDFQAKDLMERMLLVNSNERFSADQCLSHPFLNLQMPIPMQLYMPNVIFVPQFITMYTNQKDNSDISQYNPASYSNDSIQLTQISRTCLNGRVDTLISNDSQMSIDSLKQKPPVTVIKLLIGSEKNVPSRFKNFIDDSDGQQSPNVSRLLRKKPVNLHQLAIRNSILHTSSQKANIQNIQQDDMNMPSEFVFYSSDCSGSEDYNTNKEISTKNKKLIKNYTKMKKLQNKIDLNSSMGEYPDSSSEV